MGTRRSLGGLLAVAAVLAVPSSAASAPVTENARVAASDGVTLQTTLTGEGPIAARPTIVEFSPYGRNTGSLDAGPEFNHLLVQIRGTGDSDGRFDALGPRTQADVAEVLAWACAQPFSDGNLGINGFSASAITIYNSLHLELPCVRAAVLKSGTFELYRDLLSPGGISNIVPGAGVLALIGAPALAQGADRLARNPASALDASAGILGAGLDVLSHQSLDDWWRERGFRGDANDLPILMIDGFYDVESRGAFEAFKELRDDGAELTVVGAHDGSPAGVDPGVGEARAWMNHHLRGVDNGVEDGPPVKLWLADGDREDLLAGEFVRRDAEDWPPPETEWESLALSPERSLTSGSLNDGSLAAERPADAVQQSYPALPSLPTSSDPHNTAILGGFGFNALATALPTLTEMALAEPLSLTYTTPPLESDWLAAGPASLELRLASTAPETAIWAVVSDVHPDGTAHPITSGRLLSSYPGVDDARSLTSEGEIVQPYGDYSAKTPTAIGERRLYRVELWPAGNRFKAGHRIRLHVLGGSAASLPTLPGLNTIEVGGPEGSRLLFPRLPGD